MSIQIDNESLRILWEEYQRRMKVAGYKQKSIHTFSFTIKELDRYLKDHNISIYTSEVGDLFVRDQQSGYELSKAELLKTQNIIRNLNACESDSFWAENYKLMDYSFKSNSLRILADRLFEHLEFWKLRDHTFKRVSLDLFRLDIFMAEKGFKRYTPKVGAGFLECMREVSHFSKGVFSYRYENTIRRLNACYENDRAFDRVPPGYEIKNKLLKKAAEDLPNVLAEKHYKPQQIRTSRFFVMKLDIYMDQYGFDEYSPEVGAKFVEYYKKQCKQRNEDGAAVPFIAHLNNVLAGEEYCRYHKKTAIECPSEYLESLEAYLDECKNQNNSNSTIYSKKLYCITFFKHLIDQGVNNLSEVTFDTVIDITSQMSEHSWGSIREYLRFCAHAFFLDKDYSYGVPHKIAKAPLPPYYSKEERLRLEKAPDRTTAIGKRDYAIILLMNRLCMRSSDVRLLTFANLNYDLDTIEFTQYKTGNPQSLPLLKEVKSAIDDYVQNGRPESNSDQIFLMSFAPYDPLSSMALHGIVTKNFAAAGVDISGRKHGGHALRASTETDMINCGLTYDDARYVAGHKDKSVILHYAGLDIEHLRMCASDCSLPTGNYRTSLGI